jgi:hypothetical protein
LAEIHLRAMRALVSELEKKRYGAARPRPSSGTPLRCEPVERPEPMDPRAALHIAETSPKPEPTPKPEVSPGSDASPASEMSRISVASPISEASRGRARYVPVAERRTVFERDGARCSYVAAGGQRCRETRYLELHHLTPFARDGRHVAANLTIFCRAHNTLAAEEDFSRKRVEVSRDKIRHECWAAQKPP